MGNKWAKVRQGLSSSTLSIGLRNRQSARIWLLIPFVLGHILSATGTENPFSTVVRTHVPVAVQGDLQKSWSVAQSYLEETLGATTGYVEIKNNSDQLFKDAIFYAEYYDDTGRFCFSLVFSIDKNVAKKEGLFGRGETRRLYSTAAFLAPASEPKELRLFLIKQSSLGVPTPIEPRPFRAPVTMEIRIPGESDKLWLGPELGVAKGPVLDLVLAAVTVDGGGHLENVNILNVATPELKTWFLRFVADQVFYTASTAGVPETANALLLVRAVVPQEHSVGPPRLPAGTIPWVADYTSALSDNSVPPVTEIIFVRPPTRVKMAATTSWTKLPASPKGLFEPMTGASNWCPGIFAIVPDPSSPNHFRRELPGNSER